MALSEFEIKRIEKTMDAFMAKRRPPAHIRKDLDLVYRLKNQSVEIFEVRPDWQDSSHIMEHPVAKMTYVKTQKIWKLFWQRADLKWHGYEPYPFGKTLEECLDVIDKDVHCCFWG